MAKRNKTISALFDMLIFGPRENPNNPYRRCDQMLSAIQSRMKKIGAESYLTREWLLPKLIEGVCEVTGIPFDVSRNGRSHRNKYAPSIDRIDSKQGYWPENCQVVIYQYNAAKGQWTDEDVLIMAKALVAKSEEKQG